MSEVIYASADNVQELLSNNQNVVLYFWAEYCQPCKRLAPLIEDMAEEHLNTKFVKIDIEENISVVPEFKLKSIPTLLFYRDGNQVGSLVGAQIRKSIENKLQESFPATDAS